MKVVARTKSVRRRNRGSVAIEIGAGALVAIGLMALALNVCFAMMAYGLNDRACREAARAAAQQNTSAAANNIAQVVVAGLSKSNSPLGAIRVVKVTYNDFNGTPPDDQSPYVSVTTSSDVRMPAPIEFFGKKVFATSIPVQKTYTFPIVRLNVNVKNN